MAPPRASYASRRLRRTVAEWCSLASGISAGASGAIPRVVWADQNLPRPALPYVSLRQISSVAGVEQQRIVTIPITSSVRVTTATVGEAARVVLGHGSPGYAVQAGDDLTDVRDRLIAAILARPDAVTCTPTAADTFTIAGLGPGLAWPLSAVEGVVVTTLTSGDVEIVESTRTSLLRVETWGFDTPDERALDYADALSSDIGRSQTAAFMSERGCSFVGSRPTTTDISALSGAERETRAYFDVRIAQWTRHTDANAATLTAAVTPTLIPGVDLIRPTA